MIGQAPIVALSLLIGACLSSLSLSLVGSAVGARLLLESSQYIGALSVSEHWACLYLTIQGRDVFLLASFMTAAPLPISTMPGTHFLLQQRSMQEIVSLAFTLGLRVAVCPW